jgi:hypothetical protein
MTEVSNCNPPHYDEISVTRLYDQCIKMPGMAELFPDKYPKGRQCNREYFFSMLATVQPDYTDKMLRKCKEIRFAADGEAQKTELIDMDPHWFDQLKEFPQFSSKNNLNISILTAIIL